MREHQIVITLKPEQFLQVQKLARSAGAKSMGMFVRQQLLAALGIDGAAAGQSINPGSDLDLEPIKSELLRLHGQLREIVAESLAGYSNDFDADMENTAISVELEGGLPFTVESPEPAATEFGSDEFEKTAEKTFAISPRLGAFDAVGTQPQALPNRPAESSFEQSLVDSIEQVANSSSEQEPAESLIAAQSYAPAEKPVDLPDQSRRDDGASAAPPDSVSGDLQSPKMPVFFQQKAPPKTPWVFNNTESAAPSAQAMQGYTNDASQAERRDPLSELLTPGELNQTNDAASGGAGQGMDDDDSFDVPLSILTRRRQLAALSGGSDQQKDGSLNRPVSSVPPRKPNKPDLSDQNKPPDKPPENQEETPKPVDKSSSSGNYSPYAPLENSDDDSPFSGGPPPKKRQ